MKNIIGIVDTENKRAEIIEVNEFTGGLYWTFNHFTRTSKIIESAKICGNMARYIVRIGEGDLNLSPPTHSAGIKSVILKNGTIEISYHGVGGGGKSSAEYRSKARDVINFEIDGSSGSGSGGGRIVIPARHRILIGLDDTDSPDAGATWMMAWDIARKFDSYETRFVTCSIVQLHPVEERTQNCVSSVLEFAILPDKEIKRKFIKNVTKKVENESLSDETGLVWVERFEVNDILPFSVKCKSRRVTIEEVNKIIESMNINVEIEGRGIIGAVASLPYFRDPERGVVL